jgi:hypothetical protein
MSSSSENDPLLRPGRLAQLICLMMHFVSILKAHLKNLPISDVVPGKYT